MKVLTLLVLTTFICFWVSGQKVEKDKIIYEYNQLPLKPLDKRIKNYQGDVVLEYVKAIDADKQKNEDDYQKALAAYPAQIAEWEKAKKEVEDKYNKDLEEYNNKSTATKIIEKQVLEQNTKPVLILPPKPYAPVKKENTYQKIFDKDVLNSTYIKLDGYIKGNENPVKITFTLYGFENSEPELKTSTASVYSTTSKTTTQVNTYWYEMKYKHPVGIKVEDPYNGAIFNEMAAKTNDYVTYISAKKENSYPDFNKQSVISQLQNNVVESNLKFATETLNSMFGYSKIKDTLILYRVEAKKFNYDDLTLAYQDASLAYSLLSNDFNSAKVKLENAVSIWTKIMQEFNPEDKKGRIDNDIAIATSFNMAMAYIYLNDFMKSEEALNKMSSLKPSKSEQKLMDEIRAFCRSQKLRFEANK